MASLRTPSTLDVEKRARDTLLGVDLPVRLQMHGQSTSTLTPAARARQAAAGTKRRPVRSPQPSRDRGDSVANAEKTSR